MKRPPKVLPDKSTIAKMVVKPVLKWTHPHLKPAVYYKLKNDFREVKLRGAVVQIVKPNKRQYEVRLVWQVDSTKWEQGDILTVRATDLRDLDGKVISTTTTADPWNRKGKKK